MIAKLGLAGGLYTWTVGETTLYVRSPSSKTDSQLLLSIIEVKSWNAEDGYLEVIALNRQQDMIEEGLDIYDLVEDLNKDKSLYTDVTGVIIDERSLHGWLYDETH